MLGASLFLPVIVPAMACGAPLLGVGDSPGPRFAPGPSAGSANPVLGASPILSTNPVSPLSSQGRS